MPSWFDDDSGSDSGSSSSSLSVDDSQLNHRLSPNWERYRNILEYRGFHLDTVNDVKLFYESRRQVASSSVLQDPWGYSRACALSEGNALCRDPGLPDNLFRGCHLKDRTKIIVKAVHLRSREYEITRLLSSLSLRNDPMNHCIPVLDFIEVEEDNIAFIVMEEWSPQLLPGAPCCLKVFLQALRSCIEHVAFMHRHSIAHLDLSLTNLVTDYKGHYACIDYELSLRFDGASHPQVCGIRGTELPPELERGGCSDPFKVDIWALGVLILKASYLTGKLCPQLTPLTNIMLNDDQDRRPTAMEALSMFDTAISTIDNTRLHDCISFS
ncbi:hypothetical protein BV25DRAFT_1821753 [Artomyces pyxidatus]|uniref:Uncharacterized protein n=1 Tax=Artomyces pyxidatus TaxID=48021 RepID=A0ACB8TBC7_9AGAM|nr:hypothetical protein BV25DRAFT_1821753 [Artomyces pyxidatus]